VLGSLRIFNRHTQANAIAFMDYVIAKFPFRIREVRIDNGHEFQAKFYWYFEDDGIRHAYIKPSSPHLNGKVERSPRTDDYEFYQLLTDTDDIDLKARLAEWESFYNLFRPHGAFNGKAPYEPLRERLLFKCQPVSQVRHHYKKPVRQGAAEAAGESD
jgi:transposase InsO family protein